MRGLAPPAPSWREGGAHTAGDDTRRDLPEPCKKTINLTQF